MTIDEDPKEAAIREVEEEVGLSINQAELIFEGEVKGDSCLGGADIHYWYLYKTKINSEAIKLDEEGSEWEWINYTSINPDKVVYPVKYFLMNKEIFKKLKK